MDRNRYRGGYRDRDSDRNMSTEVDRCAPTLCHMLYSPNDGDGDGHWDSIYIKCQKNTLILTCISGSVTNTYRDPKAKKKLQFGFWYPIAVEEVFESGPNEEGRIDQIIVQKNAIKPRKFYHSRDE